MAAVLLAKSVGGNLFYGFISAVAFATILAVVAGLTLSGASAVSHDLYATVIKQGKADSASELRVSRITTLVLGFTLFQELFGLLKEPYGGYTTTQVGIYGWGVLVIILVAAAILTTMKWPEGVPLDGPPGSDFGVDPEVERVPKIPQQYKHDERPRIAGFAIEQYTDEELHS